MRARRACSTVAVRTTAPSGRPPGPRRLRPAPAGPSRQRVRDPRAFGLAARQDLAAGVEAAAGGDAGGVRGLAGEDDRIARATPAGRTTGPGCTGVGVPSGRPPPRPSPRSGPGTSPRPGPRCSTRGPGRASPPGRTGRVRAQAQQQGQDLAAYGRVQGGHRLVGDDEFGLQDERARDDDALALAAGELVRVAEEEALRGTQPGPGEGLGDRLAARPPRTRGSAGPRPPRRTPCAAG